MKFVFNYIPANNQQYNFIFRTITQKIVSELKIDAERINLGVLKFSGSFDSNQLTDSSWAVFKVEVNYDTMKMDGAPIDDETKEFVKILLNEIKFPIFSPNLIIKVRPDGTDKYQRWTKECPLCDKKDYCKHEAVRDSIEKEKENELTFKTIKNREYKSIDNLIFKDYLYKTLE